LIPPNRQETNARVVKAIEVGTQVPSIWGVQSFLRGMHWRKTTRIRATLYMNTVAATTIDIMAKDFAGNIRW
jgi:hypothetical protein